MRHAQRGFGWGEVIIILVAVGMLAGIVYGINSWWNGKISAAKEEGRQEIRLAVAKERNDKLLAAQARIAELEGEKKAQEDEHVATVAAIDQEGQDALKALEGKHSQFLDDLFAGRIRVPGQGGSGQQGCTGGGDGRPGAVASAAGVGDGEAGAELSQPLRERVAAGHKIAGEADTVVVQLTACQKIVVDDRKVR